MNNWKSQCIKSQNQIKLKFEEQLKRIKSIKEAIKNEKISTVQKNKEIKFSKINQYSAEMNELTHNAEKSIHLIF